jgi:hypothetical protein
VRLTSGGTQLLLTDRPEITAYNVSWVQFGEMQDSCSKKPLCDEKLQSSCLSPGLFGKFGQNSVHRQEYEVFGNLARSQRSSQANCSAKL